jgi:hypothetical protein
LCSIYNSFYSQKVSRHESLVSVFSVQIIDYIVRIEEILVSTQSTMKDMFKYVKEEYNHEL